MKKFKTYISAEPNWNPLTIQKRFLWKKKNKQIWRANQKQVLGTKDFESTLKNNESGPNHPLYEAFKNGSQCLVCVRTLNLQAQNEDDREKVETFLTKTWKNPYYWAAASSVQKRKGEVSRTNFSSDSILIPYFECQNQSESIPCVTLLKDVIVMFLFDSSPNVTCLYNEKYFTVQTVRTQKFLYFKKNICKIFKHEEPDKEYSIDHNTSHEIVSGQSGMNLTQNDERTQEQNEPNELFTERTGESTKENDPFDGRIDEPTNEHDPLDKRIDEPTNEIDPFDERIDQNQSISVVSVSNRVKIKVFDDTNNIEKYYDVFSLREDDLPVKIENEIFDKPWLGKTPQERSAQYKDKDQIWPACNIINKIKYNNTSGYFFVHYDELYSQKQRNKIDCAWRTLWGTNTKNNQERLPKHSIFVLFDRNKKSGMYTGKVNSYFNKLPISFQGLGLCVLNSDERYRHKYKRCPTGKLFRILRVGNFQSSGCCYNGEPIKDHIKIHRPIHLNRIEAEKSQHDLVNSMNRTCEKLRSVSPFIPPTI